MQRESQLVTRSASTCKPGDQAPGEQHVDLIPTCREAGSALDPGVHMPKDERGIAPVCQSRSRFVSVSSPLRRRLLRLRPWCRGWLPDEDLYTTRSGFGQPDLALTIAGFQVL